MRRVLVIVDRNARRLFAYVRDKLAGIEGDIEVIEDRRSLERRVESQPSQMGHRPHDRRKDDVSKDLKRFGWAVVRRRDEAGSDGDQAP